MLPEPVFLDTSFIPALLDTKDKWHQTAQKIVTFLNDMLIVYACHFLEIKKILTFDKDFKEYMEIVN